MQIYDRYMVVLNDFTHSSALFGSVIHHDPCKNSLLQSPGLGLKPKSCSFQIGS